MPTISVDKARLFKELGRDFTTEEFDELCFEFGIELDEDTTDSKRPIVDGVQEPPQLKIEIPANRYDMLCFEGIAMNLKVFLGQTTLPNFRLKAPAGGELLEVNVSPDTGKIRPYFSGAILRGIKFDKNTYESFIALQDKLHQNLARQRTLVAIGTHDLDTIEGPFSYEALPPEQIKFAPLNQTKEMSAPEMMQFFEKDKHLSRYLHIIRDSPVYPIIYDNKRRVLSMPPIINSNHSKITLDTKNVFIDITATDKTKLEIVNHILVSMFSQYCSEPFTVEPIKINSPHEGQTREAPDLTPRATQASISYINSVCGLQLSPQEMCDLLKRMCYHAKPSLEPDKLDVDVPPTRADVLHQADIMEDVAIAYGFNKLDRKFKSATTNVGAALPINKLADIVRLEAAMAGWAEVMPLILCSHDENYAWLNRKDDNLAIRLANPKTQEYQIVRTSLLPGLLKTIRENRHHSVPMRVFEVSDIGLKDEKAERKAKNVRHFAACWYGKSSGFEMVHGLLDRIMLMLKTTFVSDLQEMEERRKKEGQALAGYWLEEFEDATFLPGHAASIFIKVGEKPIKVGAFGILHPTVLKNFDLVYPVSALEIELEYFL
ncbi:phenylalanine--tRNA ligase subunit beta [Elsinoe ampelina]|uniref:Phenylalanine--tRNA ligase beta subunit n=1 Tax=Elsinoe ampelina TaxID=302913 RepID=A0A6A6G2B7_9PEZI|nr:phenylalanine--tRNA ligase subunit beta [Elsinoe ampelina]